MLNRNMLLSQVRKNLEDYPVVALLGPRQCGKTTIAKVIADEYKATYFDLEDPECPLQSEIAKTVLTSLSGLVVIDEVQLQPKLFSLLRVLADDANHKCQYLLLGSASSKIVKGVSESLAGRISLIEMSGFDVQEIEIEQTDIHWVRGGFPRSFLSKDEGLSLSWRSNFVKTFLESDIPQLGIRIPAVTLRRFWTMLSHYHGNIWKASDLARAMSVKEDTARHYLDILSGTYLIRQLPAWFENTGKRVVKAPKVYFRDSGILHFFLGVQDKMSLLSHPKLGFSWEGYCIEQIIRILHAQDNAYFYATHSGAELDLLIFHNGKRIGFEFKYMDLPKPTRSMTTVQKDLKLDMLYVVYPGVNNYPLKEGIELLPIQQIPNLPDIL